MTYFKQIIILFYIIKSNIFITPHSNPDIEKETIFPPCHCEHLKGAYLHTEVTAFTDSLCYLGVTARRRGNLIEKDGIASFYSPAYRRQAMTIP